MLPSASRPAPCCLWPVLSTPCPTPSWDSTPTAKAKVILLRDQCVPEVRVVPKEKLQPAAVFGLVAFLHLRRGSGEVRASVVMQGPQPLAWLRAGATWPLSLSCSSPKCDGPAPSLSLPALTSKRIRELSKSWSWDPMMADNWG